MTARLPDWRTQKVPMLHASRSGTKCEEMTNGAMRRKGCLLPLYLEVWSRVNSRGRCVAGNLPFGETARCKYAVQMPIEGTIDGANGRSRHKGHCRAVVAAATMGAVCS